jgi:transmembrane sensor
MEKELDNIDDLIGKVLAGEATPLERQRLNEWTKASAGNQRYLEELEAIFEKAMATGPQLEFDAEAAWQKVKGRIGKEDARFVSLPTVSLIRMAAGIVIILGAWFFLFRKPLPTETFALRTEVSTVSDTLPDGSTAFLNKRSTIAYEYSPADHARKLKLTGEGYFEVKHEKTRQFIIEADEVFVQDIGTAFNVRAYPESDTVEVTVKTGEVRIYTRSKTGLNLRAGETGIYRKTTKEFRKLENADTNVLAYKTKVFSFNNADLQSVIQKINEVYSSKIRLENPLLGACRLTVNFQGDSLDTVVEVISETLKLTVTRQENEILLGGPGCN